jgi:hypothetical protein
VFWVPFLGRRGTPAHLRRISGEARGTLWCRVRGIGGQRPDGLGCGIQPAGLAEGSRWSFGAKGNDHRKTGVNWPSTPGRGARSSETGPQQPPDDGPALHFGPLGSPGLAPQPGCRTSPAPLPGGRRPPRPPATSGYPLATLRVDQSRMSKLQSLKLPALL